MNKAVMLAKILPMIILLIGCTKSDPFPGVQLPIYAGAMNLNKAFDSPAEGAKSVAYDVTMDFPANELIDFYNKEMSKIGFSPLPEEGIGTFKWEDFNTKSGRWEESSRVPARYTATWVNKEKTQRVWLYIVYKPKGNSKDWENMPMVSCSMAKYFDMDIVKKQFERENK